MDIFSNIGAFAILIAIGLIPVVFFILSVQKTLKSVAPENRKIDYRYLWLYLVPIPVISSLIGFTLVYLVAQSLDTEFKKRGLSTSYPPTLITGVILNSISLLACFKLFPTAAYTMLPWFISFIAYWMQIVESRRRLQSIPAV